MIAANSEVKVLAADFCGKSRWVTVASSTPRGTAAPRGVSDALALLLRILGSSR